MHCLLFSFCILQLLACISVTYCFSNVALQKIGSQSGHYYPYSQAARALDGNTDGSMSEGSCFKSKSETYKPSWWHVELNNYYDVHSIVIYTENDNRDGVDNVFIIVNNRSDGYDAAAAETLCGETNSEQANDKIEKVCNTQQSGILRGNYVWIATKSNRRFLQFCEVEVNSCEKGSWGVPGCDKDCSGCLDGDCRLSDGYCYRGCREGYTGAYCHMDMYQTTTHSQSTAGNTDDSDTAGKTNNPDKEISDGGLIEENNNKTLFIAAGGGGAAGLFLLCAIFCVIIVYIKKKSNAGQVIEAPPTARAVARPSIDCQGAVGNNPRAFNSYPFGDNPPPYKEVDTYDSVYYEIGSVDGEYDYLQDPKYLNIDASKLEQDYKNLKKS